MANAARRLKYEDYADNLPGLLERVDEEHSGVELERNGRIYRIQGLPTAPITDPEEARAVLRRTAGILKNVDTEALKRDLREMRQQDSEGRPG
jgi:hypothetical protein